GRRGDHEAARRDGARRRGRREDAEAARRARGPRRRAAGLYDGRSERMKVLVIGSGGRGPALARTLPQPPRAARVCAAPGNGGTALDRHLHNVPITDPDQLADFALREGIGLTVVGPEAPLAAGVVDVFRARDLRIFGPTKAAAQLESSKDFAKAFMRRHGIPSAAYQTFTRVAEARAYLDRKEAPIVVKADGLAAGKGV